MHFMIISKPSIKNRRTIKCKCRRDLQNLVFQSRSEEIIDDLALLDGKGEEVNLLQSLDLGIFYEATEFSDGNPLFLLFFASTTASAPTTTSASASTAPSSVAKTTSETSAVSTGWCCVRHWWILSFKNSTLNKLKLLNYKLPH